MAFTLNDFKAALNQGAGTVVGATAAVTINNAGKVAKAMDKTMAVADSATSAIKGAMPATNKKVDALAEKYNTRLNSVEIDQRVQEVWIKQIAQAKGVVLADREEIIEDLMEQEEVEKAAQTTQAVVEAIANPEVINMVGTIMGRLFGVNPFTPQEDDGVDEIVEVIEESEVPAEVKEKAKVKKEQPKKEEKDVATKAEKINKGRRKLGRQAPLAD